MTPLTAFSLAKPTLCGHCDFEAFVCGRREVDQRTIHTQGDHAAREMILRAHYLPQITIDLLHRYGTIFTQKYTADLHLRTIILKIYLIITYT